MAPRLQMPPVPRTPVADLPPGEGRRLPHNGYSDADLELARQKGYIPVDIRWEQGQFRVDLAGQGLIIGSVVFNDNQMAAYEAEVRLYKETKPVDKQPATMTDDLIDKLAEIRPGKLANILLHTPQDAKKPPRDTVKKLTKPSGEVEQAVADEIKKIMGNK